MADQGILQAAMQLGVTPDMLQSVIGETANDQGAHIKKDVTNDSSDFASWFQSEKGKVMMGGLFNAVSAIGAGFAGLPAGGTDMSSLGRGAAVASQGWNIAQSQYDNKKFTNFIDQQIAIEEGKPKSETDMEKLMTLQMMRRNPDAWIKGQAGVENWMAKYDYAEGKRINTEEREYQTGLALATDNFNNVLVTKDRNKLLEGDGKTLRGIAFIQPEFVAYWIGKGGPLEGISFDDLPKASKKWNWRQWLSWGQGAVEADKAKPDVSAAADATEAPPSETTASVRMKGSTGGVYPGFLGDWFSETYRKGKKKEKKTFMDSIGSGAVYPEHPF